MKIAIMGSGGVGGYFGARLAEGGADVHFVARGTHLEAMRAGGFAIADILALPATGNRQQATAI